MSRDAMALNPPDFIRGREEEGASSPGPDLQARIDETLGEITPRSVLELLALPLSDEYRTRREEGLQGVRNTLWAVGGGGAAPVAGGFTGEDFMNEAFLRMTAAEQVDLFVTTPSNIPAQNFEVNGVALAPVAKAFVGKKPHLIPDADNLFGQLQQIKVTNQESLVSVFNSTENHEIDFALGSGLCSLLVGELDECRKWLGLDSDNSPYRNPPIFYFIMENSKDDDDNDLPGLCKLLETWLMGEGGGRSPLAAAAAIVRIGAEATAVIDHVKASAIQALQKVFPLGHKDMGAEIHENDLINYVHPAVETEEPFESLGLENPEEMFSDEFHIICHTPKHTLKTTSQVLDNQMLKIWTDRAAESAQLGWVYDYTLLDLTVESLTVCVDGLHAVVEAAVKESTRLTDKVHPEKNASNVKKLHSKI
ncbi:hypothetical protein POTOM_009391 [Populus tomentosa]|uniref:Uncharacterized protein n=1 Tax=Populus tomentosa TaxID=118781 RepID=A0A8X8AAY5_POPTO|nr:hypothetical protein POTOM_009391 [Populus tomentosa]